MQNVIVKIFDACGSFCLLAPRFQASDHKTEAFSYDGRTSDKTTSDFFSQMHYEYMLYASIRANQRINQDYAWKETQKDSESSLENRN